ncbi:flagellar hook-associated protein FlgK [Marivita sp. S6314]|uniref:flagellar hook-associated protein FlgK n=1 Tax=Marivita sp. S6314 TaxID=2926406 RepID=UPI001FF4D32C|nr:flagellar hook-associated protein FlgK [Marivita sp. S6314]MCK0151710.1 flagellar hook-associated protein FlgK [Marivita sp. S6314]
MTLSGALSNAVSGLNANALGTSVLSANIANALNEHYGRRDLILSTDGNQTSGGVRASDIQRFSSPLLNHQKRIAISDHAQKNAFANFAVALENAVGSVDTLTSLSQKLTQFETSLLSAASDPSSQTRLRSVAYSADELASFLRAASDGVQTRRTAADQDIAAAVGQINQHLSQLEGLNNQIMSGRHTGQDTLALQDQRDVVLDQLSEFIPLHVIERESGAVSVFSGQGRTLLDGRAVEFGFARTPTILPHMSVQNGLLSGLLINGEPADTRTMTTLSGGRLSALFDIRDFHSPAAQTKLDGIARDMIERFGPGGPDATILPGSAGVFADDGAAFLAANERGLAGRIDLNVALKPSSDELWRWRDGLYAAAEGEPGESALLIDLRGHILADIPPSSPALATSATSLIRHVEEFASQTATNRVRSNETFEFATTQLAAQKQAIFDKGVNTDQELQKLIALEKSYAANARVVQVVDDMLTELLRI